jgi:acetamidase/formamidase
MTIIFPSVHVRREQYHLAWDRSIPPIATVESGDTVRFDALDASCGQITETSRAADLLALDFARVDQVNGPIAVAGAMPGEALQVEFLDLRPAQWGWTANIPGFGLLADDFPQPALKIWEIAGDIAEFAPGIEIPLAPFCGEIGVAPAEPGAHSTIPPGPHGGNMDTRHLTSGSTLFLPVFAEGALFSLGDGHAAQGDGEVCGTAIETPMRVTVRLTRRSDLQIDVPQFVTAGPLAPRTNTGKFFAVDGIGPDLYIAARDAVRRLIDYLEREHGLAPEQAYLLCSVAADLKISEIVDVPNWIVTAYLPLSIFR